MNSQIAERKLTKPEIVSKMLAAAGKHKARWQALGGSMIESLNQGQRPRVIAVGPAIIGGLKRLYGKDSGHSGMPGKVFEVTCRKDGTLDEAGIASIYYGVKHLGIKSMEIWGPDFGTQKITRGQIMAANIEGFREVDVREGAISGSRGTDLKNAGAGVLTCSDSRVQAYQIFEGMNAVVVSNAGNILSPVAIETFTELIEAGVPVLAVLGHSKCGAVGAALKEKGEPLLEGVLRIIRENFSREEGTILGIRAEMLNAIISCMLLGEQGGFYGDPGSARLQQLIKEKGTTRRGMFLDLASGEVASIWVPSQ